MKIHRIAGTQRIAGTNAMVSMVDSLAFFATSCHALWVVWVDSKGFDATGQELKVLKLKIERQGSKQKLSQKFHENPA
jgi:hypothetical protein